MRRPLCFLLLAACAAPPALAWKSTKYLYGDTGPLNASVHGPQTLRALEVLCGLYPAGKDEWDHYGAVLLHATGDLDGDANSHGNLLFTDERADPEGNRPSSDTALDYNGGPFYRYWIRAVEANAAANADVEPRLRRERSRTRGLDVPHRYFGYLVHLAEDQCVPAHAANVRHGPWEGVEWWHWGGWSGTSGGGGRYVPSPPAVIQSLAARYGIGRRAEFSSFWDNDQQWFSTFNRGKADVAGTVHAFLASVVQDTRDRWMPGLVEQLDKKKLFEPYAKGGRRIPDPECDASWSDEDRRNLPGPFPGQGPWHSFTHPLAEIPAPKRLYEDPARPQFRPLGDQAPSGEIQVGNTFRILGNGAWDDAGKWKDLNRGCAPLAAQPKVQRGRFRQPLGFVWGGLGLSRPDSRGRPSRWGKPDPGQDGRRWAHHSGRPVPRPRPGALRPGYPEVGHPLQRQPHVRPFR